MESTPGHAPGKGRPTRSLERLVLLAALTALTPPVLRAQTADDGIMLSRQKYCTGVFYTYDTWDHYWEGTNFRANGNIGAVTTRTIAYVGNYGLTNRLNLLVNLNHVATSASEGVLHGQAGWQDAGFSIKAKVLSVPVFRFGALRALSVVSASIPMSRYTPDDAPMSIGTQSSHLGGRQTVNYLGRNGTYLNGSLAYTLRGNVTLDRSSYYTNGQLYLSNQVAMPNVFDYNASAGYRKNDTTVVFTFSQQQTRGGGDIRPQDSPFVSNRMNSSRVGGTLTLPLPRVHDLQYWAIYNYTLDGRNVGQAHTATVGMLYTFDFERKHGR
ncbi:MAG: hypothetical protein M3O02_04550 [Acidobacteriota bacterium]|nr:hypothetical protein [Acidobacteriota bacterium]